VILGEIEAWSEGVILGVIEAWSEGERGWKRGAKDEEY
jgi:hypothetical protein